MLCTYLTIFFRFPSKCIMCKYVIYKQPQHGFCIIYNNNIKTDTLVGRTGCKHDFPIPAEYANWTTQTQKRFIFKSYLYYSKVTGMVKRTPNCISFARHCRNTTLLLIIYPMLARDSLYIFISFTPCQTPMRSRRARAYTYATTYACVYGRAI